MAEDSRKIDVLIIGGGPAGLTAAIYSSWLGLKTIVLEAGIVGGRAWLAPKIENFPGFEFGVKGNELVEKMRLQALRFHAQIEDADEVIALDLKGESKRIVSRKQSYEASALIIATGTQRRKLLVAGEADFVGRGVSYCVTCDGPFFRNAAVAVVGNGEEAAIDALFMADLASRILLISEQQELNFKGTLFERLRNKPNIEIIRGQVVRIVGEQVVQAISILEFDSKREVQRDVKGVFVSLGGVPMTAVVKNAGIATDRTGCLIVDRQQKTNIPGVFAAGDCTCGGMQVITAAGEGAMAAMRASSYVRKVNA
ncbi:MAG TPA: FAD-dependent oxidoreductase [Candidatus Limnocylindrales bacterium]|nr:FAD-dependent oxidoreductase [Candidatus Limnocylindrales bacterium]